MSSRNGKGAGVGADHTLVLIAMLFFHPSVLMMLLVDTIFRPPLIMRTVHMYENHLCTSCEMRF